MPCRPQLLLPHALYSWPGAYAIMLNCPPTKAATNCVCWADLAMSVCGRAALC